MPTQTRWSDVLDRYDVGDRVAPVVGSSVLSVVELSEEHICFQQRLWTACLGRDDFTAAVWLLDAADPRPRSTIQFAELLRRGFASATARTETDCSRVPNLCALVARDLGLIDIDPHD